MKKVLLILMILCVGQIVDSRPIKGEPGIIPPESMIKFKAYIDIKVKYRDTELTIERQLIEGLEPIQGFIMVSDPAGAEYFLKISTIEPTNKRTGERIGYIAIAYCYYKRNNEGKLCFTEPIMRPMYYPLDELEEACKKIIEDFSTYLLGFEE